MRTATMISVVEMLVHTNAVRCNANARVLIMEKRVNVDGKKCNHTDTVLPMAPRELAVFNHKSGDWDKFFFIP